MNKSEVKKLMARLAEWCHAKRGRQKELAGALGVSDQWVSNWVTGQRIPNLEHGLRIQFFLRRRGRRSGRAAKPRG
jgi:transcriptional regulator with XRE-family HTH domain